MKKTKRTIALLLATVLVFAFAAALAACGEKHECAHVCPTCGKCLDKDCADEVCKEKCAGHEQNKPEDDTPEYTVFGVTVDHEGTEADPLSVADALKIAAEQDFQQGVTDGKVYVKGIVSDVDTSSGYFNFYIDEENSSIFCYGLYDRENRGYGTAEGLLGLTGAPQKNDTVVLYSNISNFYDTYELTNSELVSLKEGEHEEQTQTPFDPTKLNWITDRSALTDGLYLVGGYLSVDNIYNEGQDGEVHYTKENYYLMSHALSSQIVGTEINDETTFLYLEDYTYYIHVEGNKISLKNTANGKYVSYSGSSTKLEWSSEEVFWELSDGNLSTSAQAPIRAIFEGTTRKLQCRYDGKFGAYSEDQISDLTFAKV